MTDQDVLNKLARIWRYLDHGYHSIAEMQARMDACSLIAKVAFQQFSFQEFRNAVARIEGL